jgi:glucokinase
MSQPKYKNIIGVDLGGTKVLAGLVDGNKIIKKKYGLLPSNPSNAEGITLKVIEIIDAVYDDSVEGIGIGVPSLVDRENGIVHSVQNIPLWKEVHLKDILEKRYNIPVFLDNDANCFALGEHIFGVGIGIENFVGITIGTGMGAGIITEGHLLKDANCGSGEFGSIPYLDGIYEDYCSGKFFKTFYNEDGQNVLKKAKNGDQNAIKAFQKFGEHMGNAIKTIMFSVDPKTIIIGGSVSNSKEFFMDAMMKTIESFPYKDSVKKLDVKFTSTSIFSILGAASLYYDRTEKINILKYDSKF